MEGAPSLGGPEGLSDLVGRVCLEEGMMVSSIVDSKPCTYRRRLPSGEALEKSSGAGKGKTVADECAGWSFGGMCSRK